MTEKSKSIVNRHWDGEALEHQSQRKESGTMKSFRGSVDGLLVASYRKGKMTWNCRITSDGFYCATFHNGRQSALTHFSKDKNEINELIKKEIAAGFRKEK